MKTYTQKEINKIIENHQHWLKEDCEGWMAMRANLSGTDLYRTSLFGADLSGANLSEANLSGANLYRTSLFGADLFAADLSGANLSGAKNIPYIPLACPSEGEFIGWKKGFVLDNKGNKYNCLIKLLIPSDAKRSSATTRKCRSNKAKVISIEISTEIPTEHVSFNVCHSTYDPEFIYKVGEIVSVDNFDDDRFNECAPGIHFFINKEEAIRY